MNLTLFVIVEGVVYLAVIDFVAGFLALAVAWSVLMSDKPWTWRGRPGMAAASGGKGNGGFYGFGNILGEMKRGT